MVPLADHAQNATCTSMENFNWCWCDGIWRSAFGTKDTRSPRPKVNQKECIGENPGENLWQGRVFIDMSDQRSQRLRWHVVLLADLLHPSQLCIKGEDRWVVTAGEES